MNRFTYNEAARWTQGVWTEPPSKPITGVMQDTRLLEAGMLYAALPGERVDGHEFIQGAMERGAAGVMCLSGKSVAGVPCLEVEDVEKGLEALARGHRTQLKGLLLGITGSAGKTTVKDLLAALLSGKGRTCSTRGNWNNTIGLPLSMLSMKTSDAYGVFELGMNQAGEIAHLADILKPAYGLITSIGEAHLENLGSLEAIAREKGSLLASLPEDGLAILDADSPWVETFKALCSCRTVRCSLSGDSDIVGSPVEGDPLGMRIEDRIRDQVIIVTLPLPGEHMRKNVLQAVAMVLELELSEQDIQTGLRLFSPAPMRWQQTRIQGRLVINDAYNANPLSMRSSIQTFAGMAEPAEKWLVLGGMSELGNSEEALHRELGSYLDPFQFSGVIGVGPKAAWICEEISSSPVYPVETHAQAVELLKMHSSEASAILIKGSRSEALENIEEQLEKISKEENGL